MSPSYSAKRLGPVFPATDPSGPVQPAGASADRPPRNPHIRIASSDRVISTAGSIVMVSGAGATLAVMFPARGPSVIMLHVLEDGQIYECEVRWRTDWRIGVRFLDILGPVRRRLYFNDQPVPLQTSPNRILRLAEAPQQRASPAPTPWSVDVDLPGIDVGPVRNGIGARRRS